MKRGFAILVCFGYALSLHCQSVLPETIPFKKATTNQQFSLTEYNTLKLSKADYTALKSGNNLPQQYIVELDTLRNAGGCMIRYGKSGKQTLMLAFKKGPEMNLFGILSDSAANSNDIQLTDFNDITGDKKTEVFVYYMIRSRRRLQIWQPAKALQLLDVEISDTKVQARKTRDNTPIGYTRDIKFNEKGFSSFDNRFLGACDENTCPDIIQRFTQIYDYTPNGFVQVLGCCELNVTKSITRAGLKSEYARLRKMKSDKDRCCENFGSGLMSVLTLMGDSVNYKHSKEYVTGFFGNPDEKLKELPGELYQYNNTPKENLEVLIYYWRGRHDYYYFIFSNKKLLHKGWYHALD